MIEWLNNIDTQLFIFFNIKCANPFFDVLMPLVTNKYTWFPVWVAVITGLLWKGGKTGRWVVVLALFSVLFADQISSHLIKPLAHRIRPCNVVAGVHLLTNKKSSFSMPSSHAANFFAVATVFKEFYNKYRIIFWSLATLVAYSRIAVGVHYPFDTLIGAIVGFSVAYLIVTLYKYFILKPDNKD